MLKFDITYSEEPTPWWCVQPLDWIDIEQIYSQVGTLGSLSAIFFKWIAFFAICLENSQLNGI